ncbi:PIN domain-containing protein [Candidatus Shapirobacteria bacterium]|nr:PIN domain-containing protein [Candidatus Shapirobacteria bacterium]
MVNKKILIDSCVWIAFYDKNDRQHEKAVEYFEKNKEKQFLYVIHFLVLIETLSILKYKKFDPEILKEIRRHASGTEEIEIVKRGEINLSPKMWGLFETVNRLGVVDVILLDYCLKNNMEIVTFDVALNELWKKLVF